MKAIAIALAPFVAFAIWSLTLLFIYLRLIGEIDWGWDTVLSPVLFAGSAAIAWGATDDFFRRYEARRWRRESDERNRRRIWGDE